MLFKQGKQPGSPLKAADVLIQFSKADNSPLHLFLGEDAYQLAEQKMAVVQSDMKQWQTEGTSTSFTINEP